ncbi:hypothetical protein DW322_04785 [Rhodococcus rhodnii]|uniref:Signaling protein n=2 Tax=Rhodococcus rhodnii TaxID=38312 RepID=R7WK84_9NOCA|nr:MHYT domain-containing protein [Rhodococcus rhodnii]EOM75695.1 signaling protein [Rhodococcus rhodnii LMG 5362]TXG89662.1 hypothetical protein DW322_04785 [Rhodococcus rhodnii]
MNADIQQFSMGTWVAILAAATSFVGVFVAIASTRTAGAARGDRARTGWVGWAAFAFAVLGAWVPQLLVAAGLGLSSGDVDVSTRIRFDLTWLVISLVVVFVLSAAAFFVLASPRRSWQATGALAAALLWVGLVGGNLAFVRSLVLQGTHSLDPLYVGVSAAVALVVAVGVVATVLRLGTRTLRLVASLPIAALVVVIYWAGFEGVSVSPDPQFAPPSGVEIFSALLPAFLLGMLVVTIPIAALLMAPDRVSAALEREADLLAEESNEAFTLN